MMSPPATMIVVANIDGKIVFFANLGAKLIFQLKNIPL